MLIDEKIDMKITNTNIEHYQSLGYECKMGQYVTINTSDLSPTSKHIESRECDCCHKPYKRQHNYNITTFLSYGKDVCSECLNTDKFKKIRRKKVEETNLERYGVLAPLQNKEIQNKQIQTMVERYGVEYPAQSTEIMDKVKETNQERYGGTNPMASSAVREKVRLTLYNNESVPTSSQQREIESMLRDYFKDDAEINLNYPESTTSLDIALLYQGNKIDIEYDAWHWHQDAQKDRRRDEFLKSRGYKILRIRSGHLLPEINQILEALEFLIKDNHSFTQIVLSDWKEE